ncbi:N-acetylated-alpha-linked acidic dipeptidase [Polymorphobacter multimanifer]|uniref:N-acetylated-alpha-linked acidic dipeptidase n=1 Tax=Polymorphobacter multimanifer TaxID=1070431 RepID=A0A841LGU5_9SPHN|nr:transferrin receptor-like dimerization domain-containing protein [Polymorphobacter multimanifer]MBB6228198.1 N-acetylated-alpha-linked acidic dipeptidase [Polymorphobacter multimanifer]
MRMMTLAIAALMSGSSSMGAWAATPAEIAALEARFDASVKSADQMAWLKQMASAPNHVGSPHNLENARFIRDQFRAWGWQAEIETFDVLYPTPLETRLEIVGGPVLGGQEPGIPEDETSNRLEGALPPYVAFGADGDVTADVVYVNYGLPEDYEALARMGISVKGKIALARYGGGWRGLKPKLAQEQGAIGSLIYSDPAQDGYGDAEVYPNGGGRPSTGVQRGSVADMTLYPGDPLTPGYGAVKGAKRLDRATAPALMKIPTLPISYGDAMKIFAVIGGPIAPAQFKGQLPLSYHTGGAGKVQLRLKVQSEWSLKPANNVIAKLVGKDRPDEWVVRGNHFDGWVFGASDPLSGMVAMMSEGKALGAMAKAGWQPSRTIVYTAWDAEEPLLLGSTEWAEHHGDELRKKAVVYLNSDSNGRGFFSAQGSHQYQKLVNAVANDVKDPQTGVSAGARLRAKVRADAYDGRGRLSDAALVAAEAGGDLPIGPLGSGSDYSAFLQHLGIPSLNISYGGENESSGSYHSIYDSYDHFVRFDDPGLVYGATLSQTMGRMVLRIAEAEVVPVRFTDLAATVKGYLAEVRALVSNRQRQDEKRAGLTAAGIYKLASDPKVPVAELPEVEKTPQIELAALENAVATLEASARAYDAAFAAKGGSLDATARDRLNKALMGIDQALLIPEGLPFRPWYRHSLYAPGRFTGYGAKTLPGVREAIEERRFADANAYAGKTAEAILRFAARIDAARGVMG